MSVRGYLQANERRDERRGKGKGVENIPGSADALVMSNLEVRDIVRIPAAETVCVVSKKKK